MAITNYGELKTAIANWLGRTDLSARVPELIRMAELNMYRAARCRGNEAALSVAIASGVMALPTGYVGMKFCYIDGAPIQVLQPKGLEYLYKKYPTRSAEGKPVIYAREQETLVFGPYPDSNYTVKGVYYKALTALSADGDTNWFVMNAPDVLLFGALMEAAPLLRHDDRIQLWEGKFGRAMTIIMGQDRVEEENKGLLTVEAI